MPIFATGWLIEEMIMKMGMMLETQNNFPVKVSRHGKHRVGYWKDYYQKNKEKLRIYHRNYYQRKLAKPKKTPSLFQQKKKNTLALENN